MKGCDDFSASIQLYLDKELRGQDLDEFLAHLEDCAACKEELREEEELSRLLQRSRPLYPASDALRERVTQLTAEMGGEKTVAPVELRKRVARILARPFQSFFSGPLVWQALSAACCLIAAGLLLAPSFIERYKATNYIDAAIAAHHSFLHGTLPLEVQSDSPEVVASWFTGKVPFTFRLPKSGEGTGEAVYRLAGGRLVNYDNKYAALVAYQMQKQRISLLVASDDSAPSAGGQEVRSGSLLFHYRKRANLNVITWTTHGLTYALVSSLPGTGQKSCLVCHQNMADSKNFAIRRHVD